MKIDGVQLATTPGALLRFECGGVALLEGVFTVGGPAPCTDCFPGTEHTATVAAMVETEIIPTATVPPGA